ERLAGGGADPAGREAPAGGGLLLRAARARRSGGAGPGRDQRGARTAAPLRGAQARAVCRPRARRRRTLVRRNGRVLVLPRRRAVTLRDTAVVVLLFLGVAVQVLGCLGVAVMRTARDRLHFTGFSTLAAVALAGAITVREGFSLLADVALAQVTAGAEPLPLMTRLGLAKIKREDGR